MKNHADLSTLRFLVADDSRFMRRLVISVLKAFGVRQIEEAATGIEAYDAICAHRADMVLLDWEFPDRTGESVMRAIRKPGHPGAYQTVIMMSGHDEQRRIERALRFGVNGYVAKPVAPKTLYQQIQQTILYPRPYLRTETYLGPQHPLIVANLEKMKAPEVIHDTPKPAKPDTSTTAAPEDDAFDLDELAILE